jgi:4-aminobutyrate aminotransferase-like enzyme
VGRLKESVERHMIRYSSAFAPYFGTKASGTCIYDENGREILDFCWAKCARRSATIIPPW